MWSRTLGHKAHWAELGRCRGGGRGVERVRMRTAGDDEHECTGAVITQAYKPKPLIIINLNL